MKRIIFCFDGTWNKLDAEHPTNVLLLASSIAPQTDEGITQIVHYDDGVGTGLRDKASGGITGYGLFKNIEEAYRFLIFNYEPGDEVLAFGFSRGAFTARSFMGFVRTVGIIQRHHTRQIRKAIQLYKSGGKEGYKIIDALDRLDFRQKYSSHISVCKEDEEYRREVDKTYIPGQSYPFSFRYVGLWDTVEALGVAKVIWQHLPFVGRKPYIGRDHRYHKHRLLGMLAAGRHAVALDERRRNFDVEPWGDIENYNNKFGFGPLDKDKPFQEKFFPGTHGSVGGGGVHKGLSDAALVWIMRGANEAGLIFDTSATSSLYEASPIFTDPLDNQHGHKKKSIKEALMKMRPKWRSFRPHSIEKVYPSAQYRWAYKGDLADGQYRSRTLDVVKHELDNLPAIDPIHRKFQSGLILDKKKTEKAIYYTVKRGDTLGEIAQEKLGDASRYKEIFEANKGMLEDPNLIYVGQVLRIPLDTKA